MKKLLSAFFALFMILSTLSIGASSADRLRLSAESNLTLIWGNVYITGICGTINADSLRQEFAHDVTLTSPDGKMLSGETLIPSDTSVSYGDASMKVLIYGDVDRNGRMNLTDAASMLKFISKWKIDVCDTAIDLNWDEKRNLTDVSLLLKRLAGWNVCIGVNIIPEQITLSYYGEDASRIGVMWHSEQKTHNPAVQVTEGVTNDFSRARTIIGDTNIGSGDANSRAVIDELLPGHTYSYRVGDASGYWSESYSFTIREDDPDSVTFVCFTDSQSQSKTGSGNNLNRAWQTATGAYDVDFAVHCGDFVESVDTRSWREMIDTSAKFMRSIPMMVVSGNHETSYAGSDGYKMQYNHFNTHMPEQSSFEKGYFYSFTYGDVHFVMLNSNCQGTADDSLSAEQIEWLRSDLEISDAKWKIAVMHHPMYSPGTGSKDRWEDTMTIALQAQLSPIFAEYGVDVVLSGHDHVYYRTHPVDANRAVADAEIETLDGKTYYKAPAGVIYTTPGCTGSSARRYCNTHPEYYVKLDEMVEASFIAVTATENSLTFDFCIPVLGTECEVLDSWGIVK